MRTFSLIGFLLLFPSIAEGQKEDIYLYKWKIKGFIRFVASIIGPSRGGARLVFSENNQERKIELLLTAPGTRDYYLYGAILDDRYNTLSVWYEYRYGNKQKKYEDKKLPKSAFSIPSAILYLRERSPFVKEEKLIWSKGRLYPVVIEPVGDESETVRKYYVSGIRKEGFRYWKGSFSIEFRNNDPRVLEIGQGFAVVKLEMVRKEVRNG